MWQAGINVIAGIWAIVSSSTGSLITPGNFLITGLVVALFGFWNPQWQWQGIVDGILGQWLILSSVIPGMTTGINLLVIGIVVTILELWRAFTAGRHAPSTSQPAH